jgi:hypothetical protein
LWLKLVDAPGASSLAAPRRSSLPVVLGLALIAAITAWLLLADEGGQLPAAPTDEPPALFAQTATCPETSPTSAGPRARETAEAARAKAERYAFDAQDGVHAVDLYGVAVSCLKVAGREAEAEGVERERAALARQLEEDLKTHVLKLERSIQYRRAGDALTEARHILGLVGHLDLPYVSDLRSLERQLAQKVAEKKKKKEKP